MPKGFLYGLLLVNCKKKLTYIKACILLHIDENISFFLVLSPYLISVKAKCQFLNWMFVFLPLDGSSGQQITSGDSNMAQGLVICSNPQTQPCYKF